jgi:hypothetical protein
MDKFTGHRFNGGALTLLIVLFKHLVQLNYSSIYSRISIAGDEQDRGCLELQESTDHTDYDSLKR